MRATVQRNAAIDDGYGQKGPPIWEVLATNVACYVWSRKRRNEIGDKMMSVVEEPGMVAPLSTDVTEDDRILTVTDRRGNQLFDTMYINSVARRKRHLELRLREYA